MDWIKNLKISQKLLVLITLSLFFVTVVGIIGFFETQKTGEELTNIYKNCLAPIRDISKIVINSNSNNSLLLSMLTTESPAKRKAYYEELQATKKENTELLKNYKNTKLTSEEKASLEKSGEYRDAYSKARNEAIKLALAGKTDEGIKTYHGKVTIVYKPYANSLKKLLSLKSEQAEAIHNQAERNTKTASLILVITILAAFGLQISLSLMISKMINDPITRAVADLDEGANQVAQASNQLSAASEQLASGSTEQAAAIQETSASIEESDSMVKQNTENTQEAARLAHATNKAASDSHEKMKNMMSAMEELKQSSDEIAKIIKVIDEIAFQTNILALNAAVEAARAGDAGKGFAVVAEEVRNLAQKSAQATRDTAKIIESNVNYSKQSVELTQDVNEDIKEIDLQARKMNDLLKEIAVASKEQSQGIEQINKAIQQMEQVLQSNASTAEESASASHELASQADSVKEIVNTLRIMVKGR